MRGARRTRLSFGKAWIAVAAAAACALAAAGCTVTDTIYLQDLSVSGPVNQPPLHITGTPRQGDVRFSPHLSATNLEHFAGHVEASGGGSKYALAHDNLQWDISRFRAGLDIDLMASDHVALALGMNTSFGASRSYWGGHAGLGFPARWDGSSGRFDIGLQLQTLDYAASTVVERQVSSFFEAPTTTVYSFYDVGTSLLWDYYASFTLNGHAEPGGPAWFGQIALSKQSLSNFYPHTEVDILPGVVHTTVDTRASSSAFFFILSPGMYWNLSPSARLAGGVRLAKDLSMDGIDNVVVMPFLQYDLTL